MGVPGLAADEAEQGVEETRMEATGDQQLRGRCGSTSVSNRASMWFAGCEQCTIVEEDVNNALCYLWNFSGRKEKEDRRG